MYLSYELGIVWKGCKVATCTEIDVFSPSRIYFDLQIVSLSLDTNLTTTSRVKIVFIVLTLSCSGNTIL